VKKKGKKERQQGEERKIKERNGRERETYKLQVVAVLSPVS
jgi:hypothetical protein